MVQADPGGVDRVAAEDRAEGERGAVALLPLFVERPAISSAPRSAVISETGFERQVERVGAVGQRVHRAGPQLPLRLAGHRLRVGDHQRRPHHPRARSSAPSGSRWIPVISAPDIVVGIATTPAPRDRGDRLRHVNHPAAAERHEWAHSHPLLACGGCECAHQRGCGGRDLPRRDLDAPRPPLPPAPAPSQRPRRAQQLELADPLLAQHLDRGADPAPPEDDGAPGVAPGEVPAQPCGFGARVLDRAQVRFDLVAQVLEVGRQRELLAEVLERLVDGEAGADRRDLEEDAARLAEVDRAEVEAVDLRRRLGAARDRLLAPVQRSSGVEAQATWWTLPAPCRPRSAGGSSKR